MGAFFYALRYTIFMTHDVRRNVIVRIFTSRFFLLGAFVIAAIIAVSFGRAYYRDYEIRQQIKSLQTKVDELERKKLESLDLLGYVKSEAYVEDVARMQLGLKKPGERVIIVNGSATSSGTLQPAGIGPDERSAVPSWKKWWGYFFDKDGSYRPAAGLQDDASRHL